MKIKTSYKGSTPPNPIPDPPKDGLYFAAWVYGNTGVNYLRWNASYDQGLGGWLTYFDKQVDRKSITSWEPHSENSLHFKMVEKLNATLNFREPLDLIPTSI